MKALFTAVWLLLGMGLGVASAHAFDEADYQRPDQVGAGSLLNRTERGYRSLLRGQAHYQVEIHGLVARVRVRQEFFNPGPDWLEAIYVMPLPADAAVNQLQLRIGEQVIEGAIQERAAARQAYVQARAAGQRAGLMEQQRPNLFTTQVANIGPGERIQVQLTWLQTVPYAQGEFTLRLPLTLKPRYIPGISRDLPPLTHGWALPTAQVPDAPWITPPQRYADTKDPLRASLQVRVTPGFTLAGFEAPYHEIAVSRQGEQYEVLPQDGTLLMNRDFVMRWRPVPQQAPVAAYFTETVAGQDHGLIMLLPPTGPQAVSIPPRQLVLVIDTSGSMAGASMAQAKQALQTALARLRPQDRFNVIAFDSDYQALFPQPVAADNRARERARRFVASLNADGGTNMAGPLQAALGGQTGTEDESLLSQVVFITDGSVGNETALLQLIQRHIGGQRLFTVGIGAAPNAYFMRKAAQFGRGTFTFVGSAGEVQRAMEQLLTGIEQPVLTDLKVELEGAEAELFPRPVPDLYLGQPLLIKARLDGPPSGVRVSGRFQGQPWHTRLDLGQGEQAAGVATLWARAKVAHLQDEGVRQGNAGQFRQAILELGLRHRLVTPYTSFVAVETVPARPRSELLHPSPVPNLMPAGSLQAAPAVGYPATALGLRGRLLLAVTLLGLAFTIWRSAPGGRRGAHHGA